MGEEQKKELLKLKEMQILKAKGRLFPLFSYFYKQFERYKDYHKQIFIRYNQLNNSKVKWYQNN